MNKGDLTPLGTFLGERLAHRPVALHKKKLDALVVGPLYSPRVPRDKPWKFFEHQVVVYAFDLNGVEATVNIEAYVG